MPPMVAAEAQPCRGASMMDQVSRAMPATERSAPSGSKRPALGSLDSGSSSRPATSAMMTTGTLT